MQYSHAPHASCSHATPTGSPSLTPRHAGADGRDDACAFVTGNERQRRLHRPVAVRCVEVRVADAARDDLDQDLAGPGCRDRHFLDRERLAERADHGRFHRLRHERSSLTRSCRRCHSGMLARRPGHAGRVIASNADAGRLGCFGITGLFYASATFRFLSSCARPPFLAPTDKSRIPSRIYQWFVRRICLSMGRLRPWISASHQGGSRD